MADIDVSYVVTAYNKAPFIDGMIGSLRTQGDQSSAEYIFVDDGSTDGSSERIEEMARDLPRVTIVRQANAGPAPATNVGVRHAVGRYVKLLDADDLLIGGITPLLCAELDRVQGDLIKGELATYRVGEIAPVAATLGNVRVLDDALYTVIATGIANTSGTLFRRSAFVEAGGCDESIFIQDFSFFLRMARRGRYLLTDVPVACIPETADGRVSGIHGQALHDVNRALLNYVAADPGLPAMYKCLAMRRAAGRTWKWAHRHRGAGPFSKPFLVHALSRLPIAALAPWILRNSCQPFYADKNLRFPGTRI
jgi:hypothetical protein